MTRKLPMIAGVAIIALITALLSISAIEALASQATPTQAAQDLRALSAAANLPGLKVPPYWHAAGASAAASAPTGGCANQVTQFQDGCAGAQTAGSVQHSNWFTSYVPVNGNAPTVFENYTRPPWNVAGVDYPVGYSGALSDGTIQANLPSCATKDLVGDIPRIRITSTPCTLDHLDFSNGGAGACVWINSSLSGNVTFTNDKFSFPKESGAGCWGNGLVDWAGYSSVDALFKFCEFNNPIATQYPTLTASTTQASAFVYAEMTGGSITVEYSAMAQCPEACIEMLSTGGTTSVTTKYSYFEGIGGDGYGSGSAPQIHANYGVLEPGGSARTSWSDSFDVLYLPPSACCGSDLVGALNQVNNNNGTITSYAVDHSVLAVRPYGSGSLCGDPPNTGCVYGPAAVLVRTGNPAGAPMNAITLTNNWMDPTGTGNYISAGTIAAGVIAITGGNPNTITCSGNKLLTNGSAITGTLTTGFVCNAAAAMVPDDFKGNATSDILWQNTTTGDVSIWFMSGGQVASSVGLGAVGSPWQIAATGDFTGTGTSDILWRNTSTGDVSLWFMSAGQVTSAIGLGAPGTAWQIAGIGDFAGIGTQDILWRNTTTGDVSIWFISNGKVTSTAGLGAPSTNWQIAGVGDFDGNGTDDILWRNTTDGTVSIWWMNGGTVASAAGIGAPSTAWQIAGTGHFDGKAACDILWRNTDGTAAIWFMSSTVQGQVSSSPGLGAPSTSWQIKATGDFNSDGKTDILWQFTDGTVAAWLMNGAQVTSAPSSGTVGSPWSIVQ
jgi:hypothetical protein